MKKKYQIPAIEINEVLLSTVIAASDPEGDQLFDVVGGDEDDQIGYGGGGDGTPGGGGAPRSNSSSLWDE